MARYAPRMQGWDAGKALAIRRERIRQDARFQAGLAAMRRRAAEVLECGHPLDSAEFVYHMRALGGFQKVLTEAFRAEVGDAVEAGVPENSMWGAIRLENGLYPNEWLEIKNAACEQALRAAR